jgi:hypothetical protein
MILEPAAEPGPVPSGFPEWIASSLHHTTGRDPLGLATITTDRIIPRLVPGVLALSVRARYFAFYTFLVDEYERLRLAATNSDLSTFIKYREYDYALAVQLCRHGCGLEASGVVGKERAGPTASDNPAVYQRGESVESHLGGYGLYYRSPLAALSIVARAGTPLGDSTTPVDVLWRDDQARSLAAAFRAAIESTEYYRHYMRSVEPVPADALRELANAACFCRLEDYPSERALLRAVFLERQTDPPGSREQRRRSFALLLWLLTQEPQIVGRNQRPRDSESSFRQAIWEACVQHITEPTPLAGHLAQWGALVAKEYMQEGLCGMWSELCTQGCRNQPENGMAPADVVVLLRQTLVPATRLDLTGASVDVEPELRTRTFARRVAAASHHLPLEALRTWAEREDTALAGLALLLTLRDRINDMAPDQVGWRQVGARAGERQPSLLRLLRWLDGHLDTDPSVVDTMQTVIERFILRPHEAIAYSKLPNFTFRFRWEDGRLRFHSRLCDGRFGLNDIRRDALTRLTRDLGLWERAGDDIVLTADGQQLVHEEFGAA